MSGFARGGAKFNQTVRKRLSLVGCREQAARRQRILRFPLKKPPVATPWASRWFMSARVWPCVTAVSRPDGRHHGHDAEDVQVRRKLSVPSIGRTS
jgi:hypothetical protein